MAAGAAPERLELPAAAAALSDALRALEAARASLSQEPLTSRPSLDRAAQLLREAAEIDGRVGAAARQLVEVIGEVRDRQQQESAAIQAQARELQQRTAAYQSLHERYQQLGEVTGQIQEAVGRAAEVARSGSAGVEALWPALLQGLAEAAEAAEALVAAAGAQRFLDLARDAEALREQLLAGRAKLSRLQPRPA